MVYISMSLTHMQLGRAYVILRPAFSAVPFPWAIDIYRIARTEWLPLDASVLAEQPPVKAYLHSEP